MDLPAPQILIIDDEESIRTSLSEFLQDFEFNVDSAENAEDALVLIEKKKYNVIIVDLRLPGMSGDTLISKAHKIDKNIHFIIHTGSVEFTLPEDLVNIGITSDNIFVKPVTDLMRICDYIKKSLKT